LILASASPRRRELLERAGLVFEVKPADIDETPMPGEAPDVYVLRICRAKAQAVDGEVVIAADTTVTIDGLILAKAESEVEASAMLRHLSGRTHQVLTGFAVRAGEQLVSAVVATDVEMIAFDPADYVASGEWGGKAGAYAIQGIGAALVKAVRGSVTNVIGLPLVEVLEVLRAHGVFANLAAARAV
jgi:septum formation protein